MAITYEYKTQMVIDGQITLPDNAVIVGVEDFMTVDNRVTPGVNATFPLIKFLLPVEKVESDPHAK